MAKSVIEFRVVVECDHVTGPFVDKDSLSEEIMPEIEGAVDGLEMYVEDSEYVVSYTLVERM